MGIRHTVSVALLVFALLTSQTVMAQDAASARSKLWDSPALKTPYRENLPDDEKVAGLSKFWSEVKFNFAYFDRLPDMDWDALYLEYLPRVRQTRSTLEYYQVLRELCARLRDGHTNVYFPRELRDEALALPPVHTRLIGDRVLIIDVYDRELRQQGVEPGVEILEVDGVPVRQYGERSVAPYQSASTKQNMDVRVYEYALLAGSVRNPVELTLRDASGNVFKRSLKRLGQADMVKISRKPPPLVEFKMLADNTAYVALNSFNEESAVGQFEALLPKISESDGLVLDLRENGGGNSGVGWAILSFLTKGKFKTFNWSTREYRPSFRAWNKPLPDYGEQGDYYRRNNSQAYTRPVIVLTSPRTFSAAEDFLVAFDAMRRGTIIGEPTGGSTGQPLSFNLPGGGTARVCTLRVTYPDGREFVGVGIQPQRVVRPTVEDFRAGRDTVLEAALEEARRWERRSAH